MTTQTVTPSAARVRLTYVEETTTGQIPYVTRTGTFTAVDAGKTITAAAAGNKFDGLVAGHSVTLNGGSLDGEVRTVLSVNISADPHVLTFSDGANFSTDTLTSITVPPTMQELIYQGGGLSTTIENDDDAGNAIRADLRKGHRKLTGITHELSVEGKLSLNQQFFDFVPSVMTNNTGWTSQYTSGSLTLTVAVVAGTPDTYTVTCSTDGWLDNIEVGHFVKLTGLVLNAAANGEPFLVTQKNTQTTGQHKITIENGRALVGEAGVAGCTISRAKYIRDSNTFKSFMVAEDDEGVPFYRRVNGVLVGGMEVSSESSGTGTCNFTMTPSGNGDWSPKADGLVAAHPFHATVTPMDMKDVMVGANMVFRYNSGIMAIQTGSFSVQDRYEAVRETKSGVGADDPSDLSGYYPSQFFMKRMGITGTANMLFTSTSLYDKMLADCTGRIDLKFQEKDCSGTGKIVIFSCPSVKFEFKPSAGATDAVRTAESNWVAGEWVFTDADSVRHSMMGQISVFE